MSGAPERMNESGTCTATDTPLTEACSLDVLARQIARLRPGHAAAHHITDLISMCRNYHRNPDVLRGNMQIVIQRILEART